MVTQLVGTVNNPITVYYFDLFDLNIQVVLRFRGNHNKIKQCNSYVNNYKSGRGFNSNNRQFQKVVDEEVFICHSRKSPSGKVLEKSQDINRIYFEKLSPSFATQSPLFQVSSYNSPYYFASSF